MDDKLREISETARLELSQCASLRDLEQLRVKFFGKKGLITAVQKTIADYPVSERPKIGGEINALKADLENGIKAAKDKLSASDAERRLANEAIDVTLPGRRRPLGRKHPLTVVTDEIINIFIGMGYKAADGPEIESEYYNFTALNIPETHTARDSQDTFYTSCGHVLRSQTSTIQIRTMENEKPPIRVVAPGRVYRADSVDATHSPIFHQIEGLAVDSGIAMSDLKGALAVFAGELFGKSVKTRFRPHYFPFTEPSAEMDVSCWACSGAGCNICKHTGFIEILGCGMVHPAVLEKCGVDPAKYSGFAFGMGIERVAMRRFNITDMRLFYENDIGFLSQF